MASVGVVIIGRNEGELLRRCLLSVAGQCNHIVYADSGSSDGSVRLAQELGATVVELDANNPFTAARGRNAGFARLMEMAPDIEFVQFVDGDCELCQGWLEAAQAYLDQQGHCGLVAGRTIEKFPEMSIYNLLCDLEWRTPFGKVASCGGIFVVRKDLFQKICGFNPRVAAGEEPEMCYRLRKLDWEIHKLDIPMAYHDAAMSKFSQWWNRSVRGGYSYAQGYALHGRGQEKYCYKNCLRIWLWGLMLPVTIFLLVLFFGPGWLALFMIYPFQLVRIAIDANERFKDWRKSFIYSFFTIIAKWPQLCGQIVFWKRNMLSKLLIVDRI